MAVKAVEMVRKIRDQHYKQTKDLAVEEQIKIIKKKSEELQKRLKAIKRPTVDKTAQAT
jgi:hypothetical protein